LNERLTPTSSAIPSLMNQQNCLTEDLKIGQELAKQIFQTS